MASATWSATRGSVSAGQRGRVVVTATATQRAEELVEPSTDGPGLIRLAHVRRQVPLAGRHGRVAGLGQEFGEGCAPLGERPRVTARPIVVGEDPKADLVWVQAGEQRRPRGAATGTRVELRKAHASDGHAIEGGSSELTPIASRIGESQVIGHDEDDVGGHGTEGRCVMRGRMPDPARTRRRGLRGGRSLGEALGNSRERNRWRRPRGLRHIRQEEAS